MVDAPEARPGGELAAAVAVLRGFAEEQGLLFAVLEADGATTNLGGPWLDILGYEFAELQGMDLYTLGHPDDAAVNNNARTDLQRTGSARFAGRMVTKAGAEKHVRWRTTWNKELKFCYALGRDVTDRVGEINRLADQANFFDMADAIMMVVEPGGRVRRLNERARSLLEIPAEQAQSIIHVEDLASAVEATSKAMHSGRAQWIGRVSTADAGHRWIDCRIVRDRGENVLAIVGHDVTNERRLAEQLRVRVNHDPLTGLASRQRTMEMLDVALDNPPVALLFCDLDRFKVVNDSLGHHEGDVALRTIGRRLMAIGDRPGCSVGRMGGDEFVVVLEGGTRARATTVAEEVRSLVAEPVVLNGNNVIIETSIGIALSSSEAPATRTTMLRSADTAMYQAKRHEQRSVVFFDEPHQAEAQARFNTEMEVRLANDEGRFVPHFQPVIDLKTGAFTGAELLVRMEMPDGSLRSPDSFLRVAEEAGLLHTIDQSMLKAAVGYGQELLPRSVLGVNVSPRGLTDPKFPAMVEALISSTGGDLKRIVFELTETSVLHDLRTATANLQQLRAMGALVALDDFGTGYSSLSHLQTLPIDLLKIDQSFIRRITTDAPTMAIVGGIMSMCAGLDIAVTAEGIETTEQLEMLQEVGCSYGQGWLFDKAMPIEDLASKARDRAGTPWLSEYPISR